MMFLWIPPTNAQQHLYIYFPSPRSTPKLALHDATAPIIQAQKRGSDETSLIVMDNLYERANSALGEMVVIGQVGRLGALAWGASEISHAVEAWMLEIRRKCPLRFVWYCDWFARMWSVDEYAMVCVMRSMHDGVRRFRGCARRSTMIFRAYCIC